MGAAVQVADAVEPLDDDGQERQQPVEEDGVGVVVADVLDTVAVLGVVEALVFDLPAALGHAVERAASGLGGGKVGQPVGLDHRAITGHKDTKEGSQET